MTGWETGARRICWRRGMALSPEALDAMAEEARVTHRAFVLGSLGPGVIWGLVPTVRVEDGALRLVVSPGAGVAAAGWHVWLSERRSVTTACPQQDGQFGVWMVERWLRDADSEVQRIDLVLLPDGRRTPGLRIGTLQWRMGVAVMLAASVPRAGRVRGPSSLYDPLQRGCSVARAWLLSLHGDARGDLVGFSTAAAVDVALADESLSAQQLAGLGWRLLRDLVFVMADRDTSESLRVSGEALLASAPELTGPSPGFEPWFQDVCRWLRALGAEPASEPS